MDYDAQGFALATDGTKLFYGIRGHGPDAVLIDGIGCDGWAWNHIQPHLSQRLRVIHTHYRGHGRSGALTDPTHDDVITLADDVAHVMDAAQSQSAVLICHSMGTQVALEVFRAHKDRVRALILICGGSGKITHTFHGNDVLRRALPKLIEQVHKHPLLVRALWGRLPPLFSYRMAGWLGEVDGTALDPEDFRRYVEHLSDVGLELYLSMLQKAGEHSAEDVLAQVDVPTLVIAAERDTFTPKAIVKAVADQVAGAEYLELIGASHAAPLEQPDVINRRVDAFLAQHALNLR